MATCAEHLLAGVVAGVRGDQTDLATQLRFAVDGSSVNGFIYLYIGTKKMG